MIFLVHIRVATLWEMAHVLGVQGGTAAREGRGGDVDDDGEAQPLLDDPSVDHRSKQAFFSL